MPLAYPVSEVRSYPERVLTDRHDYHQVLVGLEGTVELEAGGSGVHVDAGVLAPIAVGESHYYLAAGRNRCLVLDLPVEWCELLGIDHLTRRPAFRLPSSLHARAFGLDRRGPTELAHWLSAALTAPGRSPRAPRLRLMQLLPEILATLDRPWRVSQMAARCHLAEAVFARQFRALVGKAPHAWLTERRLERACQHMRDTTASLTEVALSCGFADAAHFSRTFRERMGCSPRDWRENHASPAMTINPCR